MPVQPSLSCDALGGLTVPDDAYQYTVEFTDSLVPSSWSSLPAVLGTGSEMTVTHEAPKPAASFYRVKVEHP